MKYKKAEDIFPKELLDKIQEHVQGELIYIPKIKSTHKKWGENTNSKALVAKRNAQIQLLYRNGVKIEDLAKQYFLSVESIKKIIYKK